MFLPAPFYKREDFSDGLEKLISMNGHLPPLSALRAFEAAARLMSFSKAADELNVTPAAISHQIHALEQDLGVRLFNRLNRSVELTASARVLLPGLSEAFAGIHASVRRLRAHNDTGTLTVTASPSFAAKWLVPDWAPSSRRIRRWTSGCRQAWSSST